MGAIPQEAGFVDAIEALLQTPIFYDEARTALLQNQPELLNDEELGARRELGSAAVRLIARSRTNERAIARHHQPDLDVKQWNAQNCLSELKISQIGAVAVAWPKEVRQLARQVALINMGEKFLESDEAAEIIADLHKTGHGDQVPYFTDAILAARVGSLGTTFTRADGKETLSMRGTTIVAPTGYGKTWLLGLIARAFGVGKPIEGIHNDTDPVKMLITEHTQELINQIAGVTGDKTFTRASNGMVPRRYFQHEQDSSGSIVVASHPKFREGKLNDYEPDILAFDECHLLTGPAMLDAVIDRRNNIMIFGLTATPDYDAEKDVRRILPHIIQHDDLSSGIEKGVLNGAQLFSLYIAVRDRNNVPRDPTQFEIDQKVCDFLEPLIMEGRRGLVVCRAGDESVYAKQLANRLRRLKFPNGRRVRAQAIGSFNPRQSDRAIRDYHEGKLDVITTVNKGVVGLNGEFDFVHLNCDIESLLRITQIIGRGTRPSDRFPFTVYGQTIVPGKRFGRRANSRLTIYDAFGLEEVEQGLVLGPISKEKPRQFLGRESSFSDDSGIIDLQEYAAEIRAMLDPINHRLVGEVFLGPGQTVEVPEDYVALSALIADKDLTRRRAIIKLTNAGLDWVGEKKKPGERFAERWYEPDAEILFGRVGPRDPIKDLERAQRVASLAAGELTTRSEEFASRHRSIASIATEYNIGWRQAKAFVEKSGVSVLSRQHNHLDGFFIRRGKDEALVKAIIEQEIPYAELGETTNAGLMEEFGIEDRTMIDNIVQRSEIQSRHRRLRGGGTAFTYSIKHSELLRQEIERRLSCTHAAPDGMSVRHLLAELGWADKTLKAYMSPLDHALSKPRWIADSRGSLQLLSTWTRAEGEAVIARVRRARTNKEEERRRRRVNGGETKKRTSDSSAISSYPLHGLDENLEQAVTIAGIADMLGTTEDAAYQSLTTRHRHLASWVSNESDTNRQKGQLIWTIEAAGEVVGEILAKRYSRQTEH